MATAIIDPHEFQAAQEDYRAFLDDSQSFTEGYYESKIVDMLKRNENRLTIQLNDLRQYFPSRCKKLLKNGFHELSAFQAALLDVIKTKHSLEIQENLDKYNECFIGLEGSFGYRHVTPRTLNSNMLNNMVCVEGIVTRCSGIKPKIVKSVHYCEQTKKYREVSYSDWTCTNYDDKNRTNSAMPTQDDEGNLLTTEYGLCTFRDTQSFTIQEMPEKAPAGQIPRSVDIIADDDLVDKIKPGDRCIVVGAFRVMPSKKFGVTNGIYRTSIIANNVQIIAKNRSENVFTTFEIDQIKQFARDRSINQFEVLARSIAPSIHGHEYLKKATLCMLVGGTEKHLSNGSRLRGDINIMFIGDPSTAKSQMLRYVLASQPNAIATTGRGTSGVGLTAAVTTDPDSGERRLEAGAMVLADRGIVCIDEFDKMSDIDRTAIHEVMEQGRVTIAKAGIHAKLNARCSVLAAANPVYGRYDPYKSPMDNIGMQDSLLSRFDLLFVVLDQPNIEKDKKISEHVLRIHKYRDPKEQDGAPFLIETGASRLATNDDGTKDDNDDNDDESNFHIYERHDPSFHGELAINKQARDKQKIVTMLFMKKYIEVANMVTPKLKIQAANALAEEYARLRSHELLEQGNTARTSPVTARTLETLIRLATAHAKIRMSNSVIKKDAKVAIELVQYAYFQKVFEKPKASSSKRRKDDEKDRNQDSDNSDSDDESSVRTSKRRKEVNDTENDTFDFKSSRNDTDTICLSPKPDNLESQRIPVDDAKLETFMTSLSAVFESERAQQLEVCDIIKKLDFEYEEGQVRFCLDKMMEDNKIFVADDIVFLV